MRTNFGAKASPVLRLSPEGIALQPSPATAVVGPTGRAAAATAQAPTLKIAQRHVENIALWFESESDDQEASGGTGGGGEGTDDPSVSSTIKAVYSQTWGEDDGRLGGLDLLLTLCAIPSDSSAAANLSTGADATHDRNKGESCCGVCGNRDRYIRPSFRAF